LHKPLQHGGLIAEDVVRQLVADVAGGLHGSAGGRFYAWVIRGAVLAADCAQPLDRRIKAVLEVDECAFRLIVGIISSRNRAGSTRS
jgi:hypothetical protein